MYMYMYMYMYVCIYIYIYIYIHTYKRNQGPLEARAQDGQGPHDRPRSCGVSAAARERHSEGGTIRLGTLLELEFLNASFSSCLSY